MSLWTRFNNLFRTDRLRRDLDEELESHIAEAIEEGRSPEEARKAFGSPLRQREASRDLKLIVWLDSLRADAVFGWRQLNKNKTTSASAILSLALAIGACTAAFRLIDAVLLRPLPVAAPDRMSGSSMIARPPISADSCRARSTPSSTARSPLGEPSMQTRIRWIMAGR